jgi:fluoride ion exporter CrcB/FEX
VIPPAAPSACTSKKPNLHAGALIGRSRVVLFRDSEGVARAPIVCSDAEMQLSALESNHLSELAGLLLAPLGTAIGAVARDWLTHAARTRVGRADLGLATAQVAACFVAGLCAGAGAMTAALCVAGFAGGLSTWSALAVDSVGWWRAQRWGLLVFHLVVVLGLSYAAFLGGRALGGGAV